MVFSVVSFVVQLISFVNNNHNVIKSMAYCSSSVTTRYVKLFKTGFIELHSNVKLLQPLKSIYKNVFLNYIDLWQ